MTDKHAEMTDKHAQKGDPEGVPRVVQGWYRGGTGTGWVAGWVPGWWVPYHYYGSRSCCRLLSGLLAQWVHHGTGMATVAPACTRPVPRPAHLSENGTQRHIPLANHATCDVHASTNNAVVYRSVRALGSLFHTVFHRYRTVQFHQQRCGTGLYWPLNQGYRRCSAVPYRSVFSVHPFTLANMIHTVPVSPSWLGLQGSLSNTD